MVKRNAILVFRLLAAAGASAVAAKGPGEAIAGANGLEATPLIGEGDFPAGLMGVGVDGQGKIYVTGTTRRGGKS